MIKIIKLTLLLGALIAFTSCSDESSEKTLLHKAQKGDNTAKVQLGLYYFKKYRSESYKSSRTVTEEELSALYSRGWKFLSESIAYLESEAAKGHRPSMEALSTIYSEGWGATKDKDIAFKWDLKLAEGGDYFAQQSVAFYYTSKAGFDSPPPFYSEKQKSTYVASQAENHYNAIKWFKLSLDNPNRQKELDPFILSTLGNIYVFRKQWRNAFDTYESCKDCFPAELAELYLKGLGVRQSNTKAKELYGISCDRGIQSSCDKYADLNLNKN